MIRTMAAVIAISIAHPALAQDTADPICDAAATRMMHALTAVSPEFATALASKDAGERSTIIRDIAVGMRDQQNGSCEWALILPDASMQALAQAAIQ